MNKNLLKIICCITFLSSMFIGCKHFTKTTSSEDVAVQRENDKYNGPAERAEFEFERIKDPALGYVPAEKMLQAVDYTENLKSILISSRRTSALTWTERGPIYDFFGPSNNLPRGDSSYTAGRTRAILIDTLADPSGNTVFCGGVAGGLWKCTNFLSAIPNWQAIDDRFENLGLTSICQDPTNASIMYFSTGEATNSYGVWGAGIWKSADGGKTWSRLPSTINFIRTFKIACDASGNVYLAARPTTTPVSQPFGLLRSKDKGVSWQNITPATLISSNNICTDIEISSTGKLHASFGYLSGATPPRIQHVYTNDPANVTTTSGWNNSKGIRSTGAFSSRMELATLADTLYAVTTNLGQHLDSCYKSIDGGATWTKQNTTAFAPGILGGQGSYNLTLAINPANSAEFLVGGLDAYRSVNSGVTIPLRTTFWANSAPYVHADHHFMQWWRTAGQNRIIIGGDGGVFLSTNGGVTYADKNRNLAIKQFYSGAIHPARGSNYLLGGTQDNGTHQLTNPGLSWSTEVTAGDGCFVHINQQNPQIQFGSTPFNSYKRSLDGGATWSPVNISGSNGLFVNPFDYDDGKNIMYASYGGIQANNQILRWSNAASISAPDTTALTLNGLTRNNLNSNATAFKVSPNTLNRVFIGGSSGKVLRLDNASSVTSDNVNANVTDISGTMLPNAYISCVNTGSSDDTLVATFSSYGVPHVWYSSNGGTSWIAIDGTAGSGGLPNMPVRWAVFNPQDNKKLIIATEAGVYSTDAVNGANTVWSPETSFPTVRTDMLKVRFSDNTIVAATHGRGLFTAVLPASPEVRFNAPFLTTAEASGVSGCRAYKDYSIDVSIVAPPTGDATVTYNIQSANTAIEGLDFDYTANGDFSNPTKQQVFVNGAATTKTLNIRLYDDAALEGAESFTITLDVSGTTNAFAGAAKKFTFTINDNDAAPTPTALGSATVGTGNYGSYIQPFRGNYEKCRNQYIYLASELSAAGILSGNINSLSYKVTSKTSTSAYQGLTISLKNTTSSNFSSLTFEEGTTPYFSAAYSTVVGINTFNFTTPFSWDGTSNILVEICYDNTTIPGGIADFVSSHTTTEPRGIWNQASTGTGCSLTAVFNFVQGGAFVRPDIIWAGTLKNNPVDSTLNSASLSYLGPNYDMPFYNLSNNNILSRIKNLSAFNYGCTNVSIDRSGTGAVPFQENDPATYLMSKTYYVEPGTVNNSGTYEATFYFTAKEVEDWQTATGQSFNDILIIKTPNHISNANPGNPNGAGDVTHVIPERGTYGTGYFLKATFNTGFSGFGFGIGTVHLLDFKGTLTGDNTLLEWSTSSEQNSKHFEVEKSLDSINYSKIGEVKAAGFSNTTRNYSFLDNDFALDKNYYRLKVVYNDGRSKYSNVVTVRNIKDQQSMVVINNPFNQYIDVKFNKPPMGKVNLQLTDMSGRLIQKQEFNNLSTNNLRLNLSGTLSKGVYVLSAQADGAIYSMKVLKQ